MEQNKRDGSISCGRHRGAALLLAGRLSDDIFKATREEQERSERQINQITFLRTDLTPTHSVKVWQSKMPSKLTHCQLFN